jgi:hypothetical protein
VYCAARHKDVYTVYERGREGNIKKRKVKRKN